MSEAAVISNGAISENSGMAGAVPTSAAAARIR